MTRAILKPDRSVDLYAVYSENTDAILFTGTRAAVRRWLVADKEHDPEGRLDRADEHGSSSLIPLLTSGPAVLYGWQDGALRIGEGPGGPGTLARLDLLGYCRDLAADDEAAAAARVEPDDED